MKDPLKSRVYLSFFKWKTLFQIQIKHFTIHLAHLQSLNIEFTRFISGYISLIITLGLPLFMLLSYLIYFSLGGDVILIMPFLHRLRKYFTQCICRRETLFSKGEADLIEVMKSEKRGSPPPLSPCPLICAWNRIYILYSFFDNHVFVSIKKCFLKDMHLLQISILIPYISLFKQSQ